MNTFTPSATIEELLPQPGENELDWLRRLADEVIRQIRLARIVFDTNYKWEYRRNYPGAGDLSVHLSTYYAVQKAEPGFLTHAVSRIVTPEIECKGDAVRFKVTTLVNDYIAAHKKPKKKKRKKSLWVPRKLSLDELTEFEMRAAMIELEPRLPGDEEPDFDGQSEPAIPLMTVAEIVAAAKKDRESMRLIEEEFLKSELVPKTIEFPFAQGMQSKKGDKLPPRTRIR